ncbi:MAG: OmpA family protein [Acidobacteria bacterium]|nr:OmpA family protein [Acidobacteriota bacterium]
MKIHTMIGAASVFAGLLVAQAPQEITPTPVFRVSVVSRTAKAINYHHRSGATNVDFRGTSLMPAARGEARVESKQGVIKIDASMEKMNPAFSYGPEYVTYVLWAITPEGRPVNLGEIVINGNGTKSKISATCELQVFGLIVTAEPYFAVTQPSDVVVMENFVRQDTTGTIMPIDVKYELVPKGAYVLKGNPVELRYALTDPNVPLELREARNAVQIARWQGADQYAPDVFQKAVIGLKNAEDYYRSSKDRKAVGTTAREAAQRAEDARLITVRRQEEEQLAQERAAAAAREEKAKAEAADKSRQAAEQRRIAEDEMARRARAEAEQRAELARRTQAESQKAAAQAELERLRIEQEKVRASTQAEIARLDAARAAALAQQQAAQADAEKARLAADASRAAADNADRLRKKAEDEKAELRAQLLRQLNLVLETRDTARGLIVNMSDVLFDFGKSTLRAGTREKLAKVSGIVLAHPGLKLEIEGHTDSIGSEEFNQRLSEQRASAVREYLQSQGVGGDTMTSRGFGKTQPVASNNTNEGRQRNRRVEMVVSGDIISQTRSLSVVR